LLLFSVREQFIITPYADNNETMGDKNTSQIKLCPREAHTYAWQLFCCRDLDVNPMTLKIEGDLDILKTYLHTENEVARLSNQNF